MAALAPLGGAAPLGNSKKEFVEKAGARPKELKVPKKARVRIASNTADRIIKIMFFGGWSTGKTFSIKDLLELGFRIVCVTTDIGGDGLLSVELALRREGKAHLLDNLASIVLNGDEEVQNFLEEPAAFFPDIYDWNPDFLFWDGFSGWQQVDLMTAVGEDIMLSAGTNKSVGEQRGAGNKMEMQDWGTIRNATLKTLDRFCALNNKKTGKLWHKIVTAQEAMKSKGGSLADTKEPFLSGAGGKLMAGAFDLIIRTSVKSKGDDDGAREYYYVIAPNQNNASKNRGFALDPIMPGSMKTLWLEIEKQASISRGATSEDAKGEILIKVEPEPGQN